MAGLAIDRASGAVWWRGRPLLTLSPPDAILSQDLPLIAIVGSGPSLRDQQVEQIGANRAILCNGAANLTPRLPPLGVAVEDERFVFRHHAMLAALPVTVPLLLSPAALRAWCRLGPGPLEGRTVALIDNLLKPVGLARRRIDDPALRDVLIRGHRAALSVMPQTGVIITGTVAFTALQFALAAQPRRILLAGIDLANDDQPRFYETADRAPSGLTTGRDRILAGFDLARATAARRAIALECASPVSALLEIGYPLDPLPAATERVL